MDDQDDVRWPQRAMYSISKASRHVGVRRKTLRLAIKRGDLRLRHLPGRKRPVVTHADLMTWLSSLDVVPPSLPPGKEVRHERV